MLMRSTTVPGDPDHPARRWSLWPPVLELPPWIRWLQASSAHTDHPIAGALIAAAAPLEPWINLTPSFPKHVIAGAHLAPISPEGQSALDRDPDDRQRRPFGARSYGDPSDAVVVTLGAAGWSSETTAFALGRFANVMLAASPARTGREAADALGRRVQVYGGDRRVPHVRRASDVAMVAGSLTVADPGRFKEMTQTYENIGLPCWEAARRAYTEVTMRRTRG